MCTSCPCHHCEEVFTSESNLKRHIESIHTRNLSFECHICGKVYSRKDSLNRHIISHERNDFKCDKCPYTSNRAP